MRVLLLHNRYRSLGGEERAVAETAALLRESGHAVEVLERASGHASRVRAAGGMLRGGLDPQDVRRAVREHRAEVVHAHNLHPLFGRRALDAARAAGAGTVLHLHNHRLFCSIAIAFRDGAPCFRCRNRNTLAGARLRCRGSASESAVYAAGLALQQSGLIGGADALVAVSEALAARLTELGVPAGRIRSLPNFASPGRIAPATRAHKGTYALTGGRLVPEKGYGVAIEAAAAAGVPLVVVGDGPELGRLRALAQAVRATGEPDTRAPIEFTGWLGRDELAARIAGAGVVLVPSLWHEPFPYAALDALAAGVPVLASDRGGLPELVGSDATLPAGDGEAWSTALRTLMSDPAARRSLGEQAIARVHERFSASRHLAGLLEIYESVRPRGNSRIG